MQDTMTIATESGFEINVDRSILDGIAEIRLKVNGHRNCLLHWGLRTQSLLALAGPAAGELA